MIFYLFVSLLNYRSYLLDKSKEQGGTSVELQAKIDQIEEEIIRNKEVYFGGRAELSQKVHYLKINNRTIKPKVYNLTISAYNSS